MKRVLAITLAICMGLAGCVQEGASAQITSEERQRLELYVAVMKATYRIENGGSSFVAVQLDTLEGLGKRAQQEVLKELSSLSSNVYSYADVKNDQDKFAFYKGEVAGAINGTVLSVHVLEYSGDEAVITGVSWFGNLGAVFPKYRATYEKGIWLLDLISMGIS